MMIALTWIFEILLLVSSLFIMLFSFSQLTLSWIYFRTLIRKRGEAPKKTLPSGFPFVTIQLPVYNEKYVIERLIDSVARFNYPGKLFEIQVLDDSDDETTEIAKRKIREWQEKGIQIKLIRRSDRAGFKAGALEFGTREAKGELIAIFDADFIPDPDFLLNCLPYFSDPAIGMVQTHWSHLNENYSMLTRIQAFALEGHFSVEQKGRNAGGAFMNFNGTSGILRKKTIEESGGWQGDTLTEDLDLSYRAQLKGWKFLYLEDIFTLGELPVTMSAVKSQQFRWTKGPVEVARKNLKALLWSSFGFLTKALGMAHLFNSMIFPWILTSALSSIGLTFVRAWGYRAFLPENFIWPTIISLSSLIIFYSLSQIRKSQTEKPGILLKTLFGFPIFICFCLGISFHNSIAAIEGLTGKKSPFIRTPKSGITGNSGNWKNQAYQISNISIITWIEGFLALLFFGSLSYEISTGQWENSIYHIFLFTGYSLIFLLSVKHAIARK